MNGGALVSEPAAMVMVAAITSTLGLVAAVWTAYVNRREIAEAKRVAVATHREVSENGHLNESPTLKDRLSDLTSLIEQQNRAIRDMRSDMAGVREWQDEHQAWSTAETHRVWSYLLDSDRRGVL